MKKRTTDKNGVYRRAIFLKFIDNLYFLKAEK